MRKDLPRLLEKSHKAGKFTKETIEILMKYVENKEIDTQSLGWTKGKPVVRENKTYDIVKDSNPSARNYAPFVASE